jgi:hypothetical protein
MRVPRRLTGWADGLVICTLIMVILDVRLLSLFFNANRNWPTQLSVSVPGNSTEHLNGIHNIVDAVVSHRC